MICHGRLGRDSQIAFMKIGCAIDSSDSKQYKPEYMANSAGRECKIPLHEALSQLEEQVRLTFIGARRSVCATEMYLMT